MQSLGGHVRGAHSNSAGPTELSVENGNPGSVEAEFEEPGVGEEIRGYISRGYNFEQLTKMLGFNPRSVRREMARMLPLASEQEPAGREGKHELMKLGQRDMVAPESIVDTRGCLLM